MQWAKEHVSKYSMIYAGAGVGLFLFILMYAITGSRVVPPGIPKKPDHIPALQDMSDEVWKQLIEMVQLNNKA